MRSSQLIQLQRFYRLPFAAEVALAVIIKLVVLVWLWNTFFSIPQTKKMFLPTAQVEQHLLSASHAADTTRPHSSSVKAMHDPH